mmetsp:Transcript_27213/g.80252  ORF Transcript_27213/g.80252 Transcript_27213/m.80252 type:complete len:234 (-) Transcript_27213:610-1311(-)
MKLSSVFTFLAITAPPLLLNFNRCSALSSSAPTNRKTTIAVCTGPDCRVDGAADCIRRLQETVASRDGLKDSIRITGRDCVGPCGDGPCAMITDADGEKAIERQPSKTRIALIEPGLFASDPRGWYQVRTDRQAEEVVDVACRTAGVEYRKGDTVEDSDPAVFVASTRRWFDRPRNERKVLQRLMQVLVLLGLVEYEGELTGLQYGIASGLFFASDFIMKENLWIFLLDKMKR